MKKICLVCALNILFCINFYAQQHERIIRFHSDIVIETDGTVIVSEHIKVYAAGIDIKRGIIRDIPVYRENVHGKRVKVDINVHSVTCNGDRATYRSEISEPNIVITIGDVNVFLEPGEYEYVIVYSSRGHVGFFDGYDELYWNVNGTRWVYDIDQVSATMTLPGGASAIRTHAYTGRWGAKEQDYTVEDRGNVQVFTATRAFLPWENMTVAVAFPAGIIERPPPPEKPSGRLAFIFFIVTTGCLAPIYLTAKKPKKRVVIPQFRPPNNWTPGVISYLKQKGYDNTAFTAAIVNLAVKGALIISKSKDYYFLANTSDVSRLNAEEQEVHAKLFEKNERIKVSDANMSVFLRAENAHRREIRKEIDLEDYYQENQKRLALGLLVLVLFPVLYGFIAGFDELLHAIVGTFPFLLLALSAITGSKRTLIVFAIIAAALGIPFLLGFYYFVDEFNGAPALYLLAAELVFTGYAFTLYRPTELGAQAIADIKGFRMYMKTAEQHRLNLLNPPEQTPEHFEKLLPYAMALGVSNEWCKKFAGVLAAAQYQPTWNTDTFNAHTLSNFNKSFAQPFNRSMSHATTDKSSSSGSGSWSSGSSGGGYSGGGGGGGGGRGW